MAFFILLQTGKTTVLFLLLSAVIEGLEELSGSETSHEICQLNLMSSRSAGTYRGVLEGLLTQLLEWASNGKVIPSVLSWLIEVVLWEMMVLVL